MADHPIEVPTETDITDIVTSYVTEHKSELNGKSAYELAVINGFMGTATEWLISLKGTPGQKGDTGNGIVGIEKTGTNGIVDTYTITFSSGVTTTFTVTNGSKGDRGDTGTSAYQTAVNNGFTGTEAQWLASLVGSNGSDLVNQGVIDSTSSGDVTKTLVANTMVIITQPVTSLILSLPTTYNAWDEFRFAFTTGSTFTGLTLNGITYLGDTPTIAVSKYYEGSIINGKAVVA